MKKKNAIRDSTGSKSNCLSVFFSSFFFSLSLSCLYFFHSDALIRVFLSPSRLTGYLFFFFFFLLSLALSSACQAYRRRLSTLRQSSRRRKEENELTIGWLISFSSRVVRWLVDSFFAVFFFSPSTWILLEPLSSVAFFFFFRMSLMATYYWPPREYLCLIRHIVRQGHWSAVTIPNGGEIFVGYYHPINSAWKNLTTFVVRVGIKSFVIHLMLFAFQEKKIDNIRRLKLLIKRENERQNKNQISNWSICYCRLYEGKRNLLRLDELNENIRKKESHLIIFIFFLSLSRSKILFSALW